MVRRIVRPQAEKGPSPNWGGALCYRLLTTEVPFSRR